MGDTMGKHPGLFLIHILLSLVVFVMASYFLTADYPYHRTRAVQHLAESLLRFLQQVKVTALAAFGGYLRAALLLSVGVFFILLGGFLLVGQNYALLLALGLDVYKRQAPGVEQIGDGGLLSRGEKWGAGGDRAVLGLSLIHI